MKFQTHKTPEPEINLIPFIDVLLVILIFLMLTTSFSKNAQLNINLPKAQSQSSPGKGQQISIQINASGRFFVQARDEANPSGVRDTRTSEQAVNGPNGPNGPNGTNVTNVLNGLNAQELEAALLQAAAGVEQPLVIISADAQTPHQFVIQALSAAQKNQLNNIAFATDAPPQMGSPKH